MLAQRKAWSYPYLKTSLAHQKSGVCMYGWERKSLGNKTSQKSFLLVTHDDLPLGLVLCILPVKPPWALWLGKLSLYYSFCEYFTQLFPRPFLFSQLLCPPFGLNVMFPLSFGGHCCAPASWAEQLPSCNVLACSWDPHSIPRMHLLWRLVGRRCGKKLAKLQLKMQTSSAVEEANKNEAIYLAPFKKHILMHFSGISDCGVIFKATVQHTLLLEAGTSTFINGSSNKRN